MIFCLRSGIWVSLGHGTLVNVLIAYVDESYDRDFYYIGAAIATIEQWEDFGRRLQVIRDRTAAEHGTPDSIEFHAHELMGGSSAWKQFRGRHREAAGIYVAALRAAREAGVRYIFRGVDVSRLNARYSYPRPPHAVVLGHLLERIDEYTARSGQAEQTIVVADEIGTQDDHQRAFAGYQAYGTDGYRSSKLEHISAPINFASSAGSDGLQAVDLAVYVHYRRERVQSTHPAAKRTLERQWKEIGPAVEHSWEWWP
jgi:hypothetical protein